jgi:hypothetical protein
VVSKPVIRQMFFQAPEPWACQCENESHAMHNENEKPFIARFERESSSSTRQMGFDQRTWEWMRIRRTATLRRAAMDLRKSRIMMSLP